MNATPTKRLTINAASAVLQVLITGLVFFFLYRYLIQTLGVKQLGVWSLVLAASSMANLANFGITSGLVKFVAEYIALEKIHQLGTLITTAFATISLLFLVLIVLIYFFAAYLLHFIIDQAYLQDALAILPWSLLCLLINALGGVFTSTLEGFQKNYIRNIIFICTGIIYYILAILLVSRYKLVGVALAQLCQAILVLAVSFIYILIIRKNMNMGKWSWNRHVFRELITYGMKFQIVSVCQMLYEPITKALLSKFGGLGMLGFYEMASRLVGQVRALIVNANQVVIPVVTHTLNTSGKQAFEGLYHKMMSLLIIINIPLFALLLACTPVISFLWAGSVEPVFVYSMAVLSLAMFVNIMCGPAYFSAMGEGRLSILVMSHLLMAVLNIAAGYFMGVLWQGQGVIAAWCLTLIVGSLIIIIAYQYSRQLGFRRLISKNEITLFLSGVAAVSITYVIFKGGIIPLNLSFQTIIAVVITALLLIPVLLKNSMFRLVIKKYMG